MSIRTRALVFSTFFGSCIAIGLLLVSLTTNHWVRAYPKRLNSTDSKGDINFGLFYGNKDLNYGFGVRTTPIIVYTFDQNGPETMNFWLWLITALGTGFGLLTCAISAIAAVLKAASAAKRPATMVLLFASNISSAAAQVIAFVCWLVQFYQYLQQNVLAVQDRHWYSHGLAYLGYSFYLVIASTLVVILNIIILLHAKRRERADRQRLEPPSEEKNQGAIMLY
ncbi:PREDICTED: uncharacterized protein LOC108967600 [Bactrocera latifrons]|uniref:Clarin-3 n=1 Tax=Bactrocera latifrons TaxID=174628 RepID=A0A0K8V884_BACLA|nr:PREDICTED: uncharacterized protein LOC108967600 [Bactrocera latifrons]XP_018786676.1 PREDICTED: uncharacterized protein LOC108967600 [Bactrocera latifrons]XP_018786677.1 PREDICTED: uncharacterized protein LOC108967600 [Bactrocera latifrons]